MKRNRKRWHLFGVLTDTMIWEEGAASVHLWTLKQVKVLLFPALPDATISAVSISIFSFLQILFSHIVECHSCESDFYMEFGDVCSALTCLFILASSLSTDIFDIIIVLSLGRHFEYLLTDLNTWLFFVPQLNLYVLCALNYASDFFQDVTINVFFCSCVSFHCSLLQSWHICSLSVYFALDLMNA